MVILTHGIFNCKQSNVQSERELRKLLIVRCRSFNLEYIRDKVNKLYGFVDPWCSNFKNYIVSILREIFRESIAASYFLSFNRHYEARVQPSRRKTNKCFTSFKIEKLRRLVRYTSSIFPDSECHFSKQMWNDFFFFWAYYRQCSPRRVLRITLLRQIEQFVFKRYFEQNKRVCRWCVSHIPTDETEVGAHVVLIKPVCWDFLLFVYPLI